MPSLVCVEAAQSWATSLPQQKPAQAMGREVKARRAVKKAKTRGWVVERRLWKRKQIKPGKARIPGRLQFMGGGEKQLAACFRWIGDGGEDLRDGK